MHPARSPGGAKDLTERRPADEFVALLSAAVTLSRAGDRGAAIVALRWAVDHAPDDRTAHRRLAAAYAVAGDRESARIEYDRFVARLEAIGSFDAASAERTYAAVVLAPPPVQPIELVAVPRLTADQVDALRRVAVALVAIVATLAAMFAAGAQIFASGGSL